MSVWASYQTRPPLRPSPPDGLAASAAADAKIQARLALATALLNLAASAAACPAGPDR